MASQEASASLNNSTLSREGPSQEGSNPRDSTASQEASTSPNNSTLSGEGTSQEGSSPQSSNSLVSSQAGNNLVSTQAVRHSTRLRGSQASQVDSDIPQWDSKVSQGSQAVRCSLRHRAPQSSQASPGEQCTTPQGGRTSSQGGNTSSPTNSRVNNNPQGSSMEEPNPKWVINLSSKPLTPVQRSVLAKGPNFVVSPRHPPNLEYITAIESACTKLSKQDAEEVRADINWVLRSFHPQTQFN